METFLESVAKVYYNNYQDDCHSLADVLFVFPGKRAGSFFLKSLKEEIKKDTLVSSDKPAVLPGVISIADWVEQLSGRIIDSRIDQICLLYNLYREMKGKQAHNFDKFRTWAEIMLSDFNDVEMYCVDAGQLFRNVSSFKNIRSNYLTEEQQEVMRRYFGYTDFSPNTEGLWKHYGGDKELKKRCNSLFDIMGELYIRFCDALQSRGLTFSGRAYGQALQRLAEDDTATQPYKRIVMVGFNALSTVEFQIFRQLQKKRVQLADGSLQQLGDFYWDGTGVPLSNPKNIGNHFIRHDIKEFPSFFDISGSDCNSLPDVMEAIAAPSEIGQAKIAGNIIENVLERHKKDRKELLDNARIAVVLPDEKMLIPMLYSLPGSEAGERLKVNITMGYPFKMTSIATFVSLLEKLQSNYRITGSDSYKARTADIDALLSNPHAGLILTPQVCRKLLALLGKLRRTTIPVELITREGKEAELLFSPLGNHASGYEAISYLLRILYLLFDKIKTLYSHGEEKETVADRRINEFDINHIISYIDALRTLQASLQKYGIVSGPKTIFRMATGLLAGEMIHFKGEPLQGIQIMGTLETRCLDIPYIIIPSVNERIYPRRLQQRSFIPAAIRRGFNMATTRFQETIFTYYFYRMISRAKEVYMIYDSRTEGLHSGDPSRFILQLEYLYAKEKLKRIKARYGFSKQAKQDIEIVKTPEIQELINRYFTPGSGKSLSASSLNTYIDCPLRFYLQRLRGVNVETTPLEGIPANDMGSIIHKALELVYNRISGNDPNRDITAEMLKQAAADEKALTNDLIAAINSEYYKTENGEPLRQPEDELKSMMPNMIEAVRGVLEYDCRNVPFRILQTERNELHTLKLPNGMEVNFNFIIDRMDNAGNNSCTRIVDYKTGDAHVEQQTIDNLFRSGHKGQRLQMLLYSYLMRDSQHSNDPVEATIYATSKMCCPGQETARVIVNPKGPDKYNVMTDKEAFMAALGGKLEELRNPEVPFFSAPKESKVCTYCPFAGSVCKREIK